MFLNCHCIREEKVLLVIVQIIYGLFCVHFILIRLSQSRPSAVLPVTRIQKNPVKLFPWEQDQKSTRSDKLILRSLILDVIW